MQLIQRIKRLFQKADFKYQGHSFYVCDPYADKSARNFMPVSRAFMFMNALNQLEIGLRKDDLLSFQQRLEEALTAKQYGQAEFLTKMLKLRLELRTFESGFIDIGAAIIMIDDELHPTNRHTALKKELCKNEVVKSFFLSAAIRSLKSTAALSSSTDVEDYLKNQEVKEVEEIFQNSISSK